jgi:hypothetical protein
MWSKLLMTSDFTGGGRFGPKTNVHTKEDADHGLPYLPGGRPLGQILKGVGRSPPICQSSSRRVSDTMEPST